MVNCDGEFDPDTFFRMQREVGLHPHIVESAVIRSVVVCQDAKDIWAWAAKEDPDGEMRRRYISEKWGSRPRGQKVVVLG